MEFIRSGVRRRQFLKGAIATSALGMGSGKIARAFSTSGAVMAA